MLTVVIIMVLGMGLGYWLQRHNHLSQIVQKLTTWAIYTLLFLLGISIGTDHQIISNLHTLGLKALIISASGILGSIILALPVYNAFFKNKKGTDASKHAKSQKLSLEPLRGSIRILLFFAAGVAIGILLIFPQLAVIGSYSKYALYILMLLVGFGIGADPKSLSVLKSFNLKIFLVPLTTIVGTLVGVLIISHFLDGLSITESLAIGSGFGYYSLSSIIISDLRNPELGVIALLANVMREIVTLLMAPLFAQFFGKLAPIVSGGATSMDTTLPIISATSGNEYAIVSLFHGIVLTILVPFLVTFLLSLG